MTRVLDRALTILSTLILLLLTAGVVAAADNELWEAGQEPDPPVAAENSEAAARPEDERQVETLEQKGGFIGYNPVVTDGYGGRAEPYGFLHSSPSGGLFYRNLQKDSNFELEGNFLNEHDYHGDLLLDYRGDYRFHLRTESLFHNLDREILFSPSFLAGRTDAPTPAQYNAVQDPFQNYGQSVVQDNAEFRYRLRDYPLHVNLGYWRLVREGTIQQRFADASFEGTPNTIYAVPRYRNQQTQEGRLGVDAHLGPVDLIYDFRVRVFGDREAIPVAGYVARNDFTGVPARAGGLHQHNEDPDSRLISNTIKLHTSLAGGIVGSGSYGIEQRENLSQLTDTVGIKHSSTTAQNAAGDFVYTPITEVTFAVKYRHQELDNDKAPLLFTNNFVNPLLPGQPVPVQAKPRIDTTRDVISAIVYYKPYRDLSFTGEYRGDFLNRTNVSSLPDEDEWDLPASTDKHTGNLTANYRPFTGLRFTGNYSYTTTDHPSYGASFQQRHEGRLLASYTRNSTWGGTANVIVRREWNDQGEHALVKYPFDTADPFEPFASFTSRERRVLNANAAAWLVASKRLTLGANYAYQQSQVDQTVFFTSVVIGSEAPADFFDRSHVYGANATYAFTDKFDTSLVLQQVRSASAFEPQYTVFSSSSDTSGIRDITRQQTVISLLSARGEYRFTQALSSSLEYTVRDYHEKNRAFSFYDGTVHTIFASFGGKW